MLKKVIPIIRRGLLVERDPIKINYVTKFGEKNFPSLLNSFQNLHTYSRHHAKGKDIRKDKAKSTFIDENELSEFFDTKKLFSEINRPVDHFKEELINHATLRTSQGAIENVKIQFEGDTYNIQDLAEVWKKSPKLYVLDFSAFPQTIPIVMTTLQKSHLNINVQQDGTKIFVPIPKVTKEHREVLAKKAKMFFFKCKEDIRNVQMKYSKKLRAVEGVSDDTKIRIADQLTALGNKHINMAEEILKTKSDELLKSE